jgi:hypothetical protein
MSPVAAFIVNEPEVSVTVAILLTLSATVAPERGKPFELVIVPFILNWANVVEHKKNKKKKAMKKSAKDFFIKKIDLFFE